MMTVLIIQKLNCFIRKGLLSLADIFQQQIGIKELQRMSQSRRSTSMRSSGISEDKRKDPSKSIYRYNFIHRLVFRNQIYNVNGPESESFNRRTYEVPIESLTHVNRKNLGFTNQILCQMDKKNLVKLYIPVYVSLKIKSIQQVSLGELMARIGCVLIIYINTKGLPIEIIEHMKNHIMIQINRGQSLLLQPDETGKVTLKEKKDKLLYTIRETCPVQIYDDVFLSPFEILNLVLSVTFNSTRVEIDHTSGAQESSIPTRLIRKDTISDNKTAYEISFNSMRNPLEIPITYSPECRLGVYDLAEQLLDYYACNKANYSQIISSFQDFLEEKEAQTNQTLAKKIEKRNKAKRLAKKEQKQLTRHQIPHNFAPPAGREQEPLMIVHSEDKKNGQRKVKYFQYTHFLIPLYKFPGNAWATIFIPMFMLALLSVFIFLQTSASIQDKLGSIATFVLGFIALIPNIKSELPPSQKISFSEIIVYVESLNCMLSLFDQFSGSSKRKVNVWANPLFVFSFTLHVICFAASLLLLFLHYFFWEPNYNVKDECPISSPETDYKGWNNPYCDQVFLKYNQYMKAEGKLEKQVYPWPQSNFQKLREDPIREDR